MRQLTWVVLITLGLAVTTVASAAPGDWRLKPWYDAVNNELELPLTQPGWNPDCDWKGPAGPYVTNLPEQPDFPDFNCISSFMWAKTCKPGAQEVEFKKTINLPGKAADLDASLLSYGDRTMSMSIEINGSVALSAVKSVHKRDLRGKEALFKSGLNTITIRARKPNTGVECNRNGTQYAVTAQILARFATDMRLMPPPKGNTVPVKLTVTNAGPADTTYATVFYGLYTSSLEPKKLGEKTVAILIVGEGIDSDACLYSYSATTFKGTSYTGYSTYCPIQGGLKAGETRTFQAYFAFKNIPAPFFEKFPVLWGVTGDLPDPKLGNNSGGRFGYYCNPAHPPECT